MRQHIVPSIVASIVASMIGAGVAYYAKPTKIVVHTKAGEQGTRKTEWPELSQKEVDAITAALNAASEWRTAKIAIFCVEQARCGDLALNFDNAIESAHSQIETQLRFSPGIDPGLTAKPQALVDLINHATDNRLGVKLNGALPENAISIGAK